MKKHLLLALTALVLSSPTISTAAPVVFKASGATAVDIQEAVEDFRAFLGPLNPNVAGSFASGRREINWDAVPDTFSAPNDLPANFFNVNSPRGIVFFARGNRFQLSADSDNPTNTPILFGNIHPALPRLFSAFSPQRLFTALNSNVVETLFFVPGSTTSATSAGFGVVFTDVNLADSTRLELFDARGVLIFDEYVLPQPTTRQGFSFLGVGFDDGERVYLARITSGNRTPRTPARDVAVMDDFIYGEPQE